MADDGYSRKSVYRNVDKEIEMEFIKSVNIPSNRDAYTLSPKVGIRGKVKLF